MIESEEQEKQHILVIDDSRVVRWQAGKLLEKDYQVHVAEDGQQAWEVLKENEQICLAFCDLQMPTMDGYQLLEKIRSSDDLRLVHLPVVVITGDADDQDVKYRCLELGATDFIPKPFDEVILKGRAAAYTGYQSRLSELEFQVEHDQLTGLASVQYFRKFGAQGLAMAQRHQTEMTVILAELDNEDELLKRLGKKAFGQVVVHVGRKILAQLRGEDLVARAGLARYGVILPLTNRIGANRAVERIHRAVKTLRLKFAGERLQLTFSVGVASLVLDQQVDFMGLVSNAKDVMKQAKAAGGDRIALFGQAATADSGSETPQEAMNTVTAQDSKPSVPDDTATANESTEELPPLRELDDLLQQVRGAGLGKPVLRRLICRLLPLLEYADRRLELGLRDALCRAKKRLDQE